METAPRIVHNVIEQNGTDGIDASALYLGINGDLIIIGNRILNNGENGIILSGLAVDGCITQNTIVGNRWDGIKVPINKSSSIVPILRIYNNTIDKNLRNGIDFWGADLSSTLILGNIITNHPEAGVYSEKKNTLVSIMNNDIYMNHPNFHMSGADSLGLNATVNENGTPCDPFQNISENPLFRGPDHYDYRIQSIEDGYPMNSPCIDAGVSHVFYNDTDGGRNDIGYQGGGRLAISLISHDFRDLVVGLSREMEFDIYNDRDSTFSIRAIQFSDTSNFSLETSSSLDIASYNRLWPRSKVTFNPKKEGFLQSEMTFVSDDFYGNDSAKITFKGVGLKGTLIQGALTGTVQKINNPHIIINNIWVPKGGYIEIEPGVEMYFNGSYSFEVHGTLKAVGTMEDSIRFSVYRPDGKVSYDLLGNPIQWRGIRFVDASASSHLAYCIIENVNARIKIFLMVTILRTVGN
jgi:hypothetical protein